MKLDIVQQINLSPQQFVAHAYAAEITIHGYTVVCMEGSPSQTSASIHLNGNY